MAEQRKFVIHWWRIGAGIFCASAGLRFLMLTVGYLRDSSPYAGVYGAIRVACAVGTYLSLRGAWSGTSQPR